MKNKKLIIQLIKQDLRHNQLILGLAALGLQVDKHYLEIAQIVSQLMEHSGEPADEWLDTYIGYLEQATKYAICETGENLESLAIACYEGLEQCLFK